MSNEKILTKINQAIYRATKCRCAYDAGTIIDTLLAAQKKLKEENRWDDISELTEVIDGYDILKLKMQENGKLKQVINEYEERHEIKPNNDEKNCKKIKLDN